MPDAKRVTDKIEKILKRHNLKTSYKPMKTIRNILNTTKDNTKLENQGIYKIPYGN